MNADCLGAMGVDCPQLHAHDGVPESSSFDHLLDPLHTGTLHDQWLHSEMAEFDNFSDETPNMFMILENGSALPVFPEVSRITISWIVDEPLSTQQDELPLSAFMHDYGNPESHPEFLASNQRESQTGHASFHDLVVEGCGLFQRQQNTPYL